jgi:PRTRC genetic system protein E
MLFSNIAQLCAKNVTVTFQVSAAPDGQLEVIVTPKADTVNHALIAKAFTATPQELDAHLPQVIAAYAASNGNLLDVFRSIEQEAQEAAASAKAAADSEKKAAAAKSTVRKAVPGKPKSANPQALELADGEDGEDGADGADLTGTPSAAGSAQEPAALVL